MSDIPSRVLRETLRDQLAVTPPSSRSGCIDVDTLAAWGDGTLNRRDRARVESHAATCARCQAMLAAMAKTAAPLPARRWWQASTVRWLVPIAACSALAVVIWTNVPAPRRTPGIQPFFRAQGRGAASASATVSETRSSDVKTPAPKAIDKLEHPAASKPAERRGAKTDDHGLDSFKVSDGTPSVPVPAAASVVQPAPASTPERAVRDEVAPPPVQPPAELRSAAPRGRAGTAALASGQTFGLSVARLDVPSPDRSIRWRIVEGISVERSTDGGATWQVQATGATGRLTAGAAPSPTICWLVGAGGVVLVSQDGQTWQRVAFPEAIDLTTIVATDASNARVTAADGRVFRTTDGGKSWR
jgi:Photosynthesis system II assembly factor YCF48/Putative zinc-finger